MASLDTQLRTLFAACKTHAGGLIELKDLFVVLSKWGALAFIQYGITVLHRWLGFSPVSPGISFVPKKKYLGEKSLFANSHLLSIYTVM
jgi:hypothetical protein